MKPKPKNRRTRQQIHDPMLVFNMSVFNSGGGWDRILNLLKAHENGAP
jgi:rRNA maturation protein Rpf1